MTGDFESLLLRHRRALKLKGFRALRFVLTLINFILKLTEWIKIHL